MKSSGFKKKSTPLKSRVPLTKSGFKTTRSSLKQTPIRRNKEMSKQQILDSIVSKVVRLGSADSNGLVICITCLKQYHWTMMQCGHFQKRGNIATRYDPRNLGAQCEICNCYNDGEEEKFAQFIDSYYGPGTADELRKKARMIVDDFPYDQEIAKWSEVLAHYLNKNKEIQF